MEYSKTNSNNCKGLKLTTSTNICKVNNYNFGDICIGLNDETIAFIKRKQEKERLLQLQKGLLKIAKHAINISNHGYSYIQSCKPKRK